MAAFIPLNPDPSLRAALHAAATSQGPSYHPHVKSSSGNVSNTTAAQEAAAAAAEANAGPAVTDSSGVTYPAGQGWYLDREGTAHRAYGAGYFDSSGNWVHTGSPLQPGDEVGAQTYQYGPSDGTGSPPPPPPPAAGGLDRRKVGLVLAGVAALMLLKEGK